MTPAEPPGKGNRELPTRQELEELRADIYATWERSRTHTPRPVGYDMMFAFLGNLVHRAILGRPIFADEIDAYVASIAELRSWWLANGGDAWPEQRDAWYDILTRLKTFPPEARPTNPLNTGEGIRRAREQAGATLRDVASACNVNISTVWRWEHDRTRPEEQHRRALEAFFGRPTRTPPL